jgi:ferredoxin
MMPVAFYLKRHPFSLSFDMNAPPPWTDLPGDGGLLFNAQAPFNVALSPALADISLAIAMTLAIIFVMTFVFSFFYGQGAFCRILCPYAFMLAALSNLNPFQRRITRVSECTGCRKCSSNCPQGIDVSREIHHFNGKVRSRECIKCFTCVSACEHGVLKDTAAPAVPQLKPRAEYERRPWANEFGNVQSVEPITPVWDFASIIFALVCGAVVSRMGGFWFYVGAIAGFLAMRLALRLIGQRSKPGLAQKNTGVPVTVELKRSQHHGA